MYSNRDRLESALRATTNRFGNAVLDQADQLRTLLLDEYGGDGQDELADIDAFDRSIAGGTQQLAAESEPAEIVADRLRGSAEIPFADARWMVATIRSIVNPTAELTEPEVRPRIVPYVPGEDVPAELAVEPLSVARWPMHARRTVVALALGMSMVAAAAVVWVVRLRSDAADVRQELAVVRDKELAPAKRNVASLTGQLSGSQNQAAQLQSQLDTANGSLDAATASLDTTKSSLETTSAELTTAQGDLTAARLALGRIAAAFDVDITAIRPSTDSFYGALDLVTCTGFSSCEATSGFTGHFIDSGAALSFEWPDLAVVPLTTVDGFTYTGEAPIADEYRDTCKGSPRPTTVTISLSPTHYTVRASDQSVRATQLGVTWTTHSNAGGGCKSATSTYQGNIS